MRVTGLDQDQRASLEEDLVAVDCGRTCALDHAQPLISAAMSIVGPTFAVTGAEDITAP